MAHLLGAGLIHSLKVATFQKETLYKTQTLFGSVVAICKTMFLPAQLALFLLAINRKFRR